MDNLFTQPYDSDQHSSNNVFVLSISFILTEYVVHPFDNVFLEKLLTPLQEIIARNARVPQRTPCPPSEQLTTVDSGIVKELSGGYESADMHDGHGYKSSHTKRVVNQNRLGDPQ